MNGLIVVGILDLIAVIIGFWLLWHTYNRWIGDL